MKRMLLIASLLIVIAFGAGFLGGTLVAPKADTTEFYKQAVEKRDAAQKELDEVRQKLAAAEMEI